MDISPSLNVLLMFPLVPGLRYACARLVGVTN